jgi:hypothetical protein
VIEPRAVTLLNVYGSLFYAGSRTFERDALGRRCREAVVIIRMRERTMMGATAFSILSSCAGEVGARGGRVYLSGIDHELVEQYEKSGRVASSGSLFRIMEATPLLGESTRAAISEAEALLVEEPEVYPEGKASDPLGEADVQRHQTRRARDRPGQLVWRQLIPALFTLVSRMLTPGQSVLAGMKSAYANSIASGLPRRLGSAETP